MANPPRNMAFGDLMKQIRGERSQRQLARETGFSHTAIGDMEYGYVPKYHRLEDLAEVLELDGEGRRALFAAAGYTAGMETEAPDWNPDAALTAGLRLIAADYGEVRIDTRDLELAEGTPAAVETALATIRKRVCPAGCP